MLKKYMLICTILSLVVAGCAPLGGEQGSAPQGEATQPFGIQQYSVENQPDPNATQQGAPERQPQSLQLLINQDSYPMTTHIQDDKTYVPLTDVLDYLDYVVQEANDGTSIQAGFTDVVHEVDKDSSRAIVNGEPVSLSSPVITVEDETYITVEALEELLGEGYEVQLENSSLIINNVEEDFDFPGNEDLGEVEINEDEEVPTVSSAVADRIIRTARSYMGTPYKFGASSKTTKVFDCSTFTQRSFGTHGISLPRTSRAQSKVGTFIPVSKLRKGDLVFFNWPGRYKSNRIVGHVGIYMGNGKVIHTTGGKGVHIINAAKSSYWKRNYLGAKRVS